MEQSVTSAGENVKTGDPQSPLVGLPTGTASMDIIVDNSHVDKNKTIK